MAGGIGSRFWPVSTAQKPKQFLDMLGTGRTLFQHTVDRFRTICPPENMLVVTSANYSALVKEQCPELLDANILAEPCMRNTAPCIAYACYKIKKRNPKANIVVSPADHQIDDFDLFRETVSRGLDFTLQNEAILTLGISPQRPETGYGYIQTNRKSSEIAPVRAFKEKPQLDIARQYLADGGYYWNAGIFIFRVETMIKALEQYQPALAENFNLAMAHFYTEQETRFIDQIYPDCENISIDYAVMEKAQNLYVQKANFSWSDLGTWSALWEKVQKTEQGNHANSNYSAFYESSNTLVHLSTMKNVIIQGLNDYVVVEANGTLLICSKQEEQRIKQFLQDAEKTR